MNQREEARSPAMSEAVVTPAAEHPARKLALRAGLALLLLAVAALGVRAWWSARSVAAAGALVTESVDRGPIEAVVTATGTVNPVKTVLVGTYVSGPIRAIDVDFNSAVTQGQRLAKIDPAPFQMKLQQAEANLASARAKVSKSRADLTLKRRNLARSSELARQDMLAPSALDIADSDVAQAEAQLALDEAAVQQAAAGVEEAKINLGYTDILSPVNGVVVLRNVDVGQTVAASFQTPTLFQVAEDLTKMQVNANVSESDIGTLAEGQETEFTVDAYPGRSFGGRVAQVRNAPTTVANVVTYDVVIEVDNADLALKPGMTATVTIVTARRDDAVRVPLRALRFRPTGAAAEPDAGDEAPRSVAWVATQGGKGTLRRVALSTGLRDERFAEVLEGDLSPGDPVAVAYARNQDEAEPTQTSPFFPGRRR